MVVLASFYYYLPSVQTCLVGITFAIVVQIVLGFSKRVRAGILGGAISWAAITWVVLGRGSGDMVGLVQIFWTPILAILGAIIGGVAAKVLLSALAEKTTEKEI